MTAEQIKKEILNRFLWDDEEYEGNYILKNELFELLDELELKTD